MRAQSKALAAEVRQVMIVSRPIGAKVQINGRYVGNTPLVVDFAVDQFGRAINDIEIRAIARGPGVVDDVRWFPAADGNASFIPPLLAFDLSILPLYYVR